MTNTLTGLVLPKGLDDVDAAFMTQVLRGRGLIAETNEVVSQEEKGVGMTAGYFSAIKKVKCIYKHATDAPDSFVVKTWPSFELLPKESIQGMFIKDFNGYSFPAEHFYPRPKAYLAASDAPNDRWVLVLEDADTFAEHKVHEQEMNFDEVMRMIPKLVDVAVAWEGADSGDKAQQLTGLGVDFWASDANLAVYKAVMPGGAKLFDKTTTLRDSSLIETPWDEFLGGPGIAEMFTRKLDAFFAPVHPRNGATCTLVHGDLRGDNIFFCDVSDEHPDGWLCIDFQLMFRGPIPSNLAYLMTSGSVLPEVYSGSNMDKVLRTFYDQFMAKTQVYKDYTYEQFLDEYKIMTTVLFIYYVGMGAAIWRAAAFENAQAVRVELGGQGATEADLTPEELRQRMWWRKVFSNFAATFKAFDHFGYLKALPENLDGLAEWTELPPHLQ